MTDIKINFHLLRRIKLMTIRDDNYKEANSFIIEKKQ